MADIKVRKAKITDLIPDDRNLNKGTERGKQLIAKSLNKFGAVRGIAVDKDNRIIAGNKTVENAIEQGIEDVIIVETTGKELVVTRRTDTSLDTQEGREMALADNATVKVDLAWDTEQLDAVTEDYGIDAEKWGVFQESVINPDDFFNSLADGEGNNKGEKIVVEIPADMLDAKEEIKTSIEEAVRTFIGVRVKQIGVKNNV